MTRIQRADAEALATFVRRLRPPLGTEGHWNQPGTVAAIQNCTHASLSEVAVALIRLAEDLTVRSPSLLNQDGHWWYRAARAEKPAGEALRVHAYCPEHPDQPRDPCPRCQEAAGPQLTPQQIADQAAECRRIAQEAMNKARTERAELAARQEKP